MTRIESEWLVAYALVRAGLASRRCIITETKLNVGEDVLMKKCRKCGSKYYSSCVDCAFRNGGRISGMEEREPDLCEQMAGLISDAGYRLENALQWMRVQAP